VLKEILMLKINLVFLYYILDNVWYEYQSTILNDINKKNATDIGNIRAS